MLLMRRREEAEGESRMMGSGRRPCFLASRVARLAVLPEEGIPEMEEVVVDGFLRSLPKTSEYLRM